MIKIIVDHLPWPFPKYVDAVTLWPFIIYKRGIEDDLALQAHEMYHFNEQKRWLLVPWFIAYICLLPFYGGGRKHPMEKPAYAIQDKFNQDAERRRQNK